ncbi:MAG: HigA family addiction module antidote protein [Candidatus Marinimicrobia bacterium]|nr:HigA family addiction module antidote protein [Candidatus Neomarinimicrobiota bacterium]
MGTQDPTHPGEVIREKYLTPLKLSVTDAADALGVTRKTFSELVNGHSGVSIHMSLRLSKAFGTTAEYWLNLQQNYDLERARTWTRLDGIKVLV